MVLRTGGESQSVGLEVLYVAGREKKEEQQSHLVAL